VASIPEQLAGAAVTDALTGSPGEEAWPKLGWASGRGTFNATGWHPPGYSKYEPTESRGGTYYKAVALSGGNAFVLVTIPTKYGLINTAGEPRCFGAWLYATPSGANANGYQLRLVQATSGEAEPNQYIFQLRRWVEGTPVLLAESAAVTINATGAFALAVIEGKLTMWRKETSAAGWAQVGAEAKDLSFTAGYSGIDGNGSNPTLTNFSTGTLLGEAATLTGVVLPAPYEPPTRLAISLLDANDTVIARWGPDASDEGDIPRGLSFTTSDPGGFKDANLALSRRIDRDFPDLKLLRDVRIHGAGRRTAWEGRLQEIPRHHADDYSINPAAVGHVAALDDDPSFREVYVGRDLGEFTDLSSSWRLSWGGGLAYRGFNVAPDAANALPGIALELDGVLPNPPRPTAACQYDAGPGNKIAYLDYEAFFSWLDVNFEMNVGTAQDDSPAGFALWADLALGAATNGPATLTGTPGRVMDFEWRFSGAGGSAGVQYKATMRKLAWFGNHGLPIRGTVPNRGLYISDVLANIVGRCAPGLRFTTGEGGSIEPSDYICPHLVFRDPIKGSDAVLAANAYHQRSWGVEEGKRFFWRPTSSYRKRWKIRRSRGHGVDLLGPQAEAAINGVVVSYTDAGGVTRTVAPLGCTAADSTSALLEDTSPTNPVNEAGIARKWAELQLGFVTDDFGATQVGNVWLRDKLTSANSRGSVVVAGTVEDEHGVLYPSWFMRAGDSATVVDGDKIERRIIETSYDHDSRACSCNLDATPHKVEALMERMGVALVGVTD